MPPWSSRLLPGGPQTPISTPLPSGGQVSYDVPLETPRLASDLVDTPLHGVPVLDVSSRGFAANISPTRRPHRHGRSISHPFPSLFGSGKRTEKKVGLDTVEAGLDSMDDDSEQDKQLPRTASQKGPAQSADKNMVAGRCATCDSMVRWPNHLDVYRCTVCLMINDLKSSRHAKGNSSLKPLPKVDFAKNMKIPRKVLPLSLVRTRKLIDECVVAYLKGKMSREENQNGTYEGGNSGERTRSASAPTQQFRDEQGWELSLGAKPGYCNDNAVGLPEENSPHPYNYGASNPRPVHIPIVLQPLLSPAMFMDDKSLTPPTRAPPSPPFQDTVQLPPSSPSMEDTKSSAAKYIFRPVETYLAACLHDCECLNASFSTSRPAVPVRAASEASLLTEKPKGTDVFNHVEAPLSGLDGKTLLLGDFAENGSWWTGSRRPLRKRIAKDSDSFRDTGERKSARIDWNTLYEWYDAIYTCGSSWRAQWQLLKSETAALPLSSEEEQTIEDLVGQARFHVQRTFLKTVENLLRRPGHQLKSPEDCRFLLILLANPLLYPQHGAHQCPTFVGNSSSGSTKQRPNQLSRHSGSTQRKRSVNIDNPTRGSATGLHSGIIKRILGLIANLPNECHQAFVSWFRRFSESHFRQLVELVGGFVSYRLSRQGGRTRSDSNRDQTGGLVPNISGPGAGTSAHLHAALGISGSSKKPEVRDKSVTYGEDWQVKAAAKVMSLLFSANNSGRPQGSDNTKVFSETELIGSGGTPRQGGLKYAQILPTSVFYNTLLDYADLIADFDSWESRTNKFSFCQYPMFLSIWAKIHIMEYDARRQMEVKAREAFFDSILTRKAISQFLVLKVRRDCLVDDSLRGVSEVVGTGQEEIKKGLKIEFIGEEGVDAGGLRKEWFLLLVREVFDPEHGLFVYDEDSHYCYFNPHSFETSDQFFLVGLVLGLAIYNSTILDVALPPFAFRKLLASAPAYTGPATSLSRSAPGYTLEDLAEWKPALAKGLRQLLEHEGNVEEMFCRDFVVDVERYGQITQVPLCLNGEHRPVTNNNRREFVDLYVRYLLDTAVVRQFEPFKRGFFTVCGGNALSLFRPEEIELLVRGSDEPLDVTSLHAVAVYDGWNLTPNGEEDIVITWFWEAFVDADAKSQRKILGFITGSDRIPAMGATNLVIKISCLGEAHSRFPIARTCFNQLGLYRYRTKSELETKLWRAVNESEGFGLK